MPIDRSKSVRNCCASGLAMLLLGACASTDVYDPEPKFAKFDTPVGEAALTGSRIGSDLSPVEQSLGALSPTSILTHDDMARSGDSNLQRFLHSRFPNMVSGSGIDASRFEPVGGPRGTPRD
ncbi:MAG: hypothetical protein H0W33_09010 [Gammaproteobacteria bacterium]|nr:hypothetical protein [Gammaproteobacteria bacterium]